MTSKPTADELADVRTLAHGLYVQCRDSPSAYKLLTGSIRKLRNVLEEVEELLDESSTLGPYEIRVVQEVSTSRDALQQLDLALQQFKSSSTKEVNETAISDFKTVLDVSAHELSVAFEALNNTGSIELHLDTATQPPVHSPPVPSTVASATSSVRERQMSQSSSAWSHGHGNGNEPESATDVTSSAAASETERRPSDEKEVLPPPIVLQPTTQDVPVLQATYIPDWRSPFAIIDPLSIPLEHASSIILGGDEPVPSPHASSTSAQHHFLSPITSIGRLTEPQALQRSRSSSAMVPSTQVAISVPRSLNQRRSDSDLAKRARLEGAEPSRDWKLERFDINDFGLLGYKSNAPKDDANGTPGHPSATSPISTVGLPTTSINISQNTTAYSQIDSAKVAEAASLSIERVGVKNRIPLTSISPTQIDNNEDAGRSPETATGLASEEDRSSSVGYVMDQPQDLPAVAITPDRNDEVVAGDTDNEKTTQMPSPPPPSRAPPLPPSRRTKLRAEAAGRYVIANPSPAEESSEDDLYTSSRPTSIVQATQQIPEVRVDKSACLDQPIITKLEDGAVLAGATMQTTTEEAMPSARTQATAAPLSKFAIPVVAPVASAAPASDHTVETAQNLRSPHPIPQRPSRYAKRRPHPSISQTSPAVVQTSEDSADRQSEGQTLTNAGLEVDMRLKPASEKMVARARNSVDDLLTVNKSLRRQSSKQTTLPTHARSRSQSELLHHHVQPTDLKGQPSRRSVMEFYGGAHAEMDDVIDIQQERIQQIIAYWNSCSWFQAEPYLEAHLEALIEQNDLAGARRLRHLLGVCASYRGHTERAISLFLSVLRTPITDISRLDDGDCAAAYWLGDCYAMMNRRADALLAYSIAQHGSLFQDPTHPRLQLLISAEQECVQLGINKVNFKAFWDRREHGSVQDSIRDSRVISLSAAKMCIGNEPRRSQADRQHPFVLDSNKPRSMLLGQLQTPLPTRPRSYHCVSLAPNLLVNDGPWPMQFDPLFAMANVSRGRLLIHECDLIETYKTNPGAKVQKGGPPGVGRLDCFTSSDLFWLIETLRSCLTTLEMQWSEVANVEGTWLVVRYPFLQKGVTTYHYFSISIFKQSLRAGYGVNIFAEGMCSARLIGTGFEHESGVHEAERKSVKKLIRDYLDNAAKQRAKASKAKKKATPPTTPELDAASTRRSSSQISTSSATEAPPVPPRPVISP